MKFTEFHTIITKIKKKHQCQNYENYENLIIQRQKKKKIRNS